MLSCKFVDENAKLPTRGTSRSAGLDLYLSKGITVKSRERILAHTGVSIQLPEGTWGSIRPRSGLALRHGIDVGAGVIDSDYRGECMVLLFNHSNVDCTFERGTRIAQLIVMPYITLEPCLSGDDDNDGGDNNDRGTGGFGSTGEK